MHILWPRRGRVVDQGGELTKKKNYTNSQKKKEHAYFYVCQVWAEKERFKMVWWTMFPQKVNEDNEACANTS